MTNNDKCDTFKRMSNNVKNLTLCFYYVIFTRNEGRMWTRMMMLWMIQ